MHFRGTIGVNLFPHGVPLKQLELFNAMSSVSSVLHLISGCVLRAQTALWLVNETVQTVNRHSNQRPLTCA